MPNQYDVKVTWPNRPPKMYQAWNSGDDPDEGAAALAEQYEAANAFPGASSIEITHITPGTRSAVDEAASARLADLVRRGVTSRNVRPTPALIAKVTPKATITAPKQPTAAPAPEPERMPVPMPMPVSALAPETTEPKP